ncbi:hypothetical protein C1924_04790 [Stenotrophomonas sp. ESTM1D_MKCIP4_1]|uniref:protein kinase domain-containing protein n=1 Tax=Stenotrophomonas sp. ESTM1D_MKCIP4_1 TaxID=2072414 RepID=UPI000D53C37D|nr:tetratricopeptide repeat protein [Stenotrophomonas sp. ESTM1D_MKCIP4_1]AWH52534.1 hypothetical protein C1924_04790 [Stenotrophomonas sp. ESTM1D_MKCIP4_1]
MNDAVDWGAVRALFDVVCELPEPQWESELQAMTGDAVLVHETLALLRAQTQALGGMQRSIDTVLASLDADGIHVGELIGPWRLVRLLAAGGMGRVFLAERADQLYRRQVAIKVMRRSFDPALAQRLQAESQILADLQHPNIARLYDVGRAGADQPYLVMEFIDGQRLDEACRAADITLTGVLGLFCKVCRAVQAAHAQGVIHCDIKPANVLVRGGDEPVLLDFGIARLMDDGSSESAAYATPRYTSPERRSGRPAAVADDIYSLGVMLDELLALGGPAVRLHDDLIAVAEHARAPVAADRYASVDALAEDVIRFQQHRPVRARRPSRVHRARLFLRRQWRASALAACALLVAVGFVQRIGDARARAEENAAAASGIADLLVAAFDSAEPGIRSDRPMTAREVLDLGALRIEQDLSASPLVRARLQAALGRAYRNLGQPREAGALLQSAVLGLRDAGAPSREIAAAEAARALLQVEDGQQDAALQGARRGLALLEGDDDISVRIDLLNTVGRAHASREHFDEAAAAYAEALALARRSIGVASDAGLMTTLSNLGTLYRSQGKLALSERTLREAAAIGGGASPLHGPARLRVLRSLVYTLLAQGRADEAMRLAEETFAITRQLFGTGSSYTAAAEAALAGQYLDLGRYGESQQHFDAAIATSVRVDGADSLAYAGMIYGRAIMEEARGDLAMAERGYRQTLALHQRLLGNQHPRSLDVQMVLARLLMRAGRTDDAEPLLREVGVVWRRTLAADSQQLVTLELVELEWLTRAGRIAEAREAMAAFDRRNPAPVPSLALRQQMQAALLAQRSGDGDAAARWATVVATFERFYGADSTATAKWRIPYAESLLADGDAAAASAQLRRARPQLVGLSPQSEFLLRAAALEGRLDNSSVARAR